MLSPSDFNNAVPQFTNGDYASNPINPQYIAEPDAVDYNRGSEPLQTLPAQWWNWFLNKFTNRFNKLNIYVKNIFNELAQLLSLVSETPSGTEGTPTVEQLKTMFACCYPSYVKETEGLVPNTTTVNGHALTGNVSVTRSDLGLGTSSTVNTGSGAGCIPTVGTALGSTANKIVLTTASGTLQPSSSTVGSAAYCDASCFRASTWTPTCVACAGANGSGVAFGSAATCDASCFRASTWTPSSVTCATKISRTGYTSAYSFDVLLTNGSTTADGTIAYVSNQCRLLFCNTTGVLTAKCFCGCAQDSACLTGKAPSSLCVACAGKDGSGCTFGTAARYSCTYFLSATGCAADSAKLGGKTEANLCVCHSTRACIADIAWDLMYRVCAKFCCFGSSGSGASKQNCYCTLVSSNCKGCRQVLGLPYLTGVGCIVCSIGIANSTLCFYFEEANTWYDSGCRCSISCTCPQPSQITTYQSTLVLSLPRPVF